MQNFTQGIARKIEERSDLFDISKFLRRLTLKLELITYIQAVPIGVIFLLVCSGPGLKGIRLYNFFIAVTLACLAGLIWPCIRWFYIKSYLTLLFSENRKMEDIRKCKIRLLNLPMTSVGFVMMQWIVGLLIGYFLHDFYNNLTVEERIPFFILPFLILGIVGVSHFLVTEILTSSLLNRKELMEVEIQVGEYRVYSLRQRFLFTISSIVILPFLFFGYFIFTLKFFSIDTFPVEYILGIILFLLASIIVTSSKLFMQSLKMNSGKITDIINGLAVGRIKDRMSLISSDEIGQISIDLNKFINKLNLVVDTIRAEADALSGFSGKLALTTNTFHSHVQEQAASYEEMAAAVEELAASGVSISNQATFQEEQCQVASYSLRQLSEVIRTVNQEAGIAMVKSGEMASEAEKGGISIRRTVNHMDRIKESTENISSILSIIDEVADKIDLLSLNSSIEAARAGEFGNGFAVVAREMSKLAESTNENAKKIRALIVESVRNTNEGLRMMSDSSESFARIENRVNKSILMIEKISSLSEGQLQANDTVMKNFEVIAQMAAEIKNSTTEQSITLTEFSNSVTRLSENTYNVSMNSENIDQLASQLSDRAQVLDQEMKFFHG